MFHPGDTVANRFWMPFVTSEVKKVTVTYKQNDHLVLVKTVTSGFSKGNNAGETKFTITLSQQESLLFEEDKPFTIQLNVILTSGSRVASKEIHSENGVQHYKEVITSG